MEKLKIRRIFSDEIDKIGFLQPEGWEDIKFYFRFYLENSFCYPIVAIINDKIVGIANGIKNKYTAWLSHIIVAPEYRLQGIGYKLTENVINFLDKPGIKTQILIATKMGEGLYKTLGFKTDCVYKFYQAETLKTNFKCDQILPVSVADYEDIKVLDRKISGEERWHIIKKYLLETTVYKNTHSNKAEGYFVSGFGEGTIIAKNNTAGLELLKYKLNQGTKKVVLPDNNKEGQKFLIKNGFVEYNSAKRMVLGADINWKPELVFSRVGGFYG